MFMALIRRDDLNSKWRLLFTNLSLSLSLTLTLSLSLSLSFSHIQSTRQKQNVNPAKIQQSEDNFHRAKQAFDEVADELYEELPALYDR